MSKNSYQAFNLVSCIDIICLFLFCFLFIINCFCISGFYYVFLDILLHHALNSILSNYASTILTQMNAMRQGCEQVLWLYGEEQLLTEVGSMNLFVYMIDKNGGECGVFSSPPKFVGHHAITFSDQR